MTLDRGGSIVALRHPKPAIAAGICYGQLDVGLAEPCEASVRDILRQLDPVGLQRVVSSPLRRAHDVATALSGDLGLPLSVEPRLQEMDFGTWEGRAWSTIARAELDAWADDLTGFRPGGGECADDLLRRVGAVMNETAIVGERQLWVTHGGPLRCLMALSERRPLGSYLRHEVPFGSLHRFDAAGDRPTLPSGHRVTAR